MKLSVKLVLYLFSTLALVTGLISALSITNMNIIKDISGQSIEELANYSIEAISEILSDGVEGQLIKTAQSLSEDIGDYIMEAKSDLSELAKLEPSQENYDAFAEGYTALAHNPNDSAPKETFPIESDFGNNIRVPVFLSLRFANASGYEVIKAGANSETESLKDIKDEDRFLEASKLKQGQFYISKKKYEIWDCTERTSTLFGERIYELSGECPDKGINAIDAAGYKRFSSGYMEYSTPVYIKGEFRGVLTAEVNFLPIMKIVNDVKIAETGYAFLQQSIIGTPEYETGNGITLAHPSHQYVLLMDPATLYILGAPGLEDLKTLTNRQHKGETGIGRYIFRDVDKYTSYSSYIEDGRIVWAVGTTIPVDEFRRPFLKIEKDIANKTSSNIGLIEGSIERTVTGFMIVALGLGLIFVILAFIVSAVATSTLADLRKAAEEFRKGNLKYRAKIKTRDEVGELAKTFNEMAKEIGKSKQNLEKEVEEKTKELKSKVRELEKFQKFSVGREMKMIELKKQIEELKGSGRK